MSSLMMGVQGLERFPLLMGGAAEDAGLASGQATPLMASILAQIFRAGPSFMDMAVIR